MVFLRAKGGKQNKSYKRVKTQKWNDFRMVWTSVLWYKTMNINNRVSCLQKYSLLTLCCIQLLSCLHGHFCFLVNVFRFNWSSAKYLFPPPHPSHFSLSFFALNQFLDLIHHMDPYAVESAQLRLACCKEMAEVNTRRRNTGGGRDRHEHDS